MNVKEDELELAKFAAKKFEYNTETGVFTFKDSHILSLIGTRAGSWEKRECKSGHTNYYNILGFRYKKKKKRLRAHRLAWFMVYGELPEVVNHIDHCVSPEDIHNRISNLENTDTHGNSGHLYAERVDGLPTGVTKCGKRYRARVDVGGKNITVGRFKTVEAASQRYKDAVDLKRKSGSEAMISKYYKPAKKSSPYKGVSICNTRGNWLALSYASGKRKYLGSHDNEFLAACAIANYENNLLSSEQSNI